MMTCNTVMKQAAGRNILHGKCYTTNNMRRNICFVLITLFSLFRVSSNSDSAYSSTFEQRQCEKIKIEMCRNIGYNETSMPNFAENEMQSEAEYMLQTFSPLIEFVCSSQLKLFLCATYVPMCTSKYPVPIGPCRKLCESVRSRCDPVLNGFGYNWPPALDCNRFPEENNQETMCMEGDGEASETNADDETYSNLQPQNFPPHETIITTNTLECPGNSKLYVKLYRSWRCAPRCEANILFGPNEKHIAEIWANVGTYAALGLALLAIVTLIISDSEPRKTSAKQQTTHFLHPLMWCHTMVVIGWSVRFIAGRRLTSCGYDYQEPDVAVLLVDGLSNGPCAATFMLRYYFGMAACVWWAIFCLGWHRDVRRLDSIGQITDGNVYISNTNSSVQLNRKLNKNENNITRFLAWGLPAFQCAGVIIARLVDADELLGSCFVGNQSDKGLQILVATPLFCYWIFGSMNLASGFLAHRRNKEILRISHSSFRPLHEMKSCISGSFLFIYGIPCSLLLLSVIYEFANIDVWLNDSIYNNTSKNIAGHNETPMWPFMTRVSMELSLTIICSVWILVPRVSDMYKKRLLKPPNKPKNANIPSINLNTLPKSNNVNNRPSNKASSSFSYQSIQQPTTMQPHRKASSAILLDQATNYSLGNPKRSQKQASHLYVNSTGKHVGISFHRHGNETIV